MLRLSRLPAARPLAFTAPGHANPRFLDRARLLDPAHPAAALALPALPAVVAPPFSIRAFPNALLHEPTDFVPINPLLATALVRARTESPAPHKWWSGLRILDTTSRAIPGAKRPVYTTFHPKEGLRRWDSLDAMRRHTKFLAASQIADARVAALAQRGRRNLGLLFHTSKKATSKSAVIRRRLRSKMTAAIALVVARGADAVAPPETDQPRSVTPYPPLNLVSRPLPESERLFLQGWTYLVVPELAIYKMPLPNLVQAVRKALLSLSQQSMHLESAWKTKPTRTPVDGRSSSTHSPSHRKRAYPK